MAEKMRVHILAKELNVPSKSIIEKCKAEGIDSVKNHMSTLSAGLHATVREWFSEDQQSTALETAQKIDLKKVRIKRAPRKKVASSESAAATGGTPAVVGSATATLDEAPVESVAQAESGEAVVVAQEPPASVTVDSPAEADTTVAVTEAPGVDKAGDVKAPSDASARLPSVVEPDAKSPDKPAVETKPSGPAGPQNIPAAAKLQGPRVVRYEAPDYDVRPVRRSSPRPRTPEQTPRPGAPLPPPVPLDPGREAERAKKKGRSGTRRSGTAASEAGEKLAEWRDRDLAERKERLAGATGRRIHRRRAVHGGGPGQQVASGPKTSATVHEPVRMKEFCSETGLNFMQLFKVLRDEHNVLGNVSMTLPTETAQLLALHFGIELEVIPARTLLDEVADEYKARERKALQPRPPVVTLLGHVDHGKTSLMDSIRKTQVTATEDGGITQHISSYHLETAHGSVTFLDTPGHEAFTAMRARGAQMTDVVVLVIAADDGIMPQTVEAIRHAQAAEVPVVVALNKIDLGDQNKVKIFGQLTEHGLTPSGDWGGDVDVLETSAINGTGVVELVEHLADLSSLLELKADPTLPARGTVVEAETKPGVGAVARILVQEGTLRVGDFVVCGNAFGKVRAILSDRGAKLAEAGPCIPAEIWGLDEVPSAGDSFYAVESLQRAKQVATETKNLRVERNRLKSRRVNTLEEMFSRRTSDDIPELNLILKADVDGSLAALRQLLGDIPSDEVRLAIRHAGVGAVNDSDVLLAATSKAIIVAFRVESMPGAKRLAEQHGVDVRPYRVIYEASDDIRKALSGLLTPEERIEAKAVAEVRQIFRIGKLGLVAGSYVASGTLDRSHFAKVVRDDVVVRDRCKFSSLRHLKDDVRTVRAGMECGIRLEGFDDIHEGDRIETYEVLQIARTL